MSNLLLGVVTVVLTAGVSCITSAAETRTFAYDALGRLMATSSSGSVNNGIANTIAYDPAGNRTSYAITGAAGSAQLTQPSYLSPVANPHALTAAKCVESLGSVVANDTYRNGRYPLSLTALDEPSASTDSSTTFGMTLPEAGGAYSIAYTVSDALGDTGNANLAVTATETLHCF